MTKANLYDVQNTLSNIKDSLDMLQSIRDDLSKEDEEKYGIHFGKFEDYGSKLEVTISILIGELKNEL